MPQKILIPVRIHREKPWIFAQAVHPGCGRCRRHFTSAAWGCFRCTKLPTRTLGRTGIKVSILGFGSGSRFLMYEQEDKALEALSRAIDLGITYIDTATTSIRTAMARARSESAELR